MEFRNILNFALSVLIIYVFITAVPFVYNIFVLFCVSIVGINLAEWLMSVTRMHFLHKKVDPKNKAVLITGCDSGFGNKLARRMDKQGYMVFAACLYPDGGGAKELINNCSKKLSVVPMDVTSNQSIEEAKVFIAKNLQDNVLWAIVNNAGIGHAGEIDWTPLETFQGVYDVNAAGTLRVIKTFLPFIKNSQGRIINNTSICGRFICPGYIGYCMAKSSAVALTTGLRVELEKWGIKAVSVEPFFYATPLTSTESVCHLAERTWEKASPEIQQEYGEHYKENFKQCVAKLLSRCNNANISEVIDCFEDAITAQEPLSVYFPSSFWYKVLIKLTMVLPHCILDGYQRNELEGGVKPAALISKEKKS